MQLEIIGKFVRTHGLKGHLILADDLLFDVDSLKAVFIDTATGKAPYFIEEIRETAQGIMVKLDEVNSVEKAKTFLGKTIYADSSIIETQDAESDLQGFEVIDREKGRLGTVKHVTHNGVQDLLTIDYMGKEVILPLVDEFIDEIDEANKKIMYSAPEGLIDLYLTED
jgi:16S rRNA processing protein RimM